MLNLTVLFTAPYGSSAFFYLENESLYLVKIQHYFKNLYYVSDIYLNLSFCLLDYSPTQYHYLPLKSTKTAKTLSFQLNAFLISCVI